MFNLAVIPHFLLHYKIINTISSLRNSRPEVSCKKDVLRRFTKFLGKHLCQSLFLNKVAGLPVNFVKLLRTSFFIEHLWWLLLFSLESFFFFFTVFSECIFSNFLEHLKRFCYECEHTLF